MPMTFDESLLYTKTTVEVGLRAFFTKKQKDATRIHPQTAQIVDAVANFTLGGGKKLRPFLCWLGFQAVNRQQSTVNRKQIPTFLLKAMMGIELLQSFALIHDDIMDEDLTRRGKPTVHEQFKVSSLQFKVKSKHFGESMALLAGDLALAWAHECMSGVGYKRVLTVYNTMTEEMIIGQSLDVLGEQMHAPIDKKIIDTYKTAYYTIVRPLQLGILVGHGSDQLLKKVEYFGLIVGRLFQLRDDVLDGEMSMSSFERQSKPLVAQSTEAVTSMDMHESVKQLFLDFSQFVVTRQS